MRKPTQTQGEHANSTQTVLEIAIENRLLKLRGSNSTRAIVHEGF